LSHNVLGILTILGLLLVGVNLALPFGDDLVLQAWLNQILVMTMVVISVSYIIVWIGIKKERKRKEGEQR